MAPLDPALARSATFLEQLLEFGDAGVSVERRLGQLAITGSLGLDQRPQRTHLGCQLVGRGVVTARRSGARRNIQRFARGANEWWTPLNT